MLNTVLKSYGKTGSALPSQGILIVNPKTNSSDPATKTKTTNKTLKKIVLADWYVETKETYPPAVKRLTRARQKV